MMRPKNKSHQILEGDAISNTDDKHDPGLLTGLTGGAIAGGLIGGALGPLGAVTGATIGGAAGSFVGLAIAKNIDPDEGPDYKNANIEDQESQPLRDE